jgi:phytol kinase
MPTNPLTRDLLATLLTFSAALAWLRLIDFLARKVIHIGTGPLFVLCWLLFSDGPWARWLAALVPLAITAQFILVGVGAIKDPAAVRAMTRTGNPREILRGPLLYGLIFVVCTVAFWRTSPVGITALMLLCGGDGLADIVGRRLGRRKLPFNPDKSWAGSLAMFVGGYGLAVVMVLLFNALGLFSSPLEPARTVLITAGLALAAAVVEALPVGEYDNLTIAMSAVGLGLMVF